MRGCYLTIQKLRSLSYSIIKRGMVNAVKWFYHLA